MSENLVLVEDCGGVRTLTLNRPERGNALTSGLAWALVDELVQATGDDTVRVIALTGAGRSFCTGFDLAGDDGKSVRSGLSAAQHSVDDIGWIGRLMTGIKYDCDKPVVVGVNGLALGGGFALVLAADMRIVAASAVLVPGYLRIGVTPDGGLTQTLPDCVGHERAMRILLEDRRITADEALDLGLVGEVVPDDDLRERLQTYCGILAAKAPLAVRMTKRGVARRPPDLDGLLASEYSRIQRAFATDDARRARKAIRGGAQPMFSGS